MVTLLGSLRAPYSSRLWNMRQAVQKGYEALYTVQVHFLMTILSQLMI